MTEFRALSLFILLALGSSFLGASSETGIQQNNSPAAQAGATKAEADVPAPLPNGQKLVLKDGSYHLVRSYERNGDRVRYFSAERGDWEELPAGLVDWDATAKAAAEKQAAANALIEKAHKQEIIARAVTVMDVDASLPVSPGVFLPPGEGMFVVADGHVFQLDQATSEQKTDKKTLLEQVFSPVPLVPGKQNVLLPGKKAKFRLTAKNVEFYLREAPPDPDRISPIRKSSRPGDSGPEIELVRAAVHGNHRLLESIQSLFGQNGPPDRKTFPMQRWDIAQTVFRFTLGAELAPGEYALAEILPDGMNLYVWDFGVDAAASGK
jgi:hypothetical protein